MQRCPKERKGYVVAEPSEADKLLVQRFLRSVEDYGPEEVEELTGINRESVRLYRAGKWKRVTSLNRRRMQARIDGKPKPEPVRKAKKGGAGPPDLPERLELIRRLSDPHQTPDDVTVAMMEYLRKLMGPR